MADNLTEATREFIDRTWRSAITFGMPLFTRLMERQQVIPGGLEYEQIVEIADQESLVQVYGPNDPLVGGTKDIMDKPHWHAAYLTIPIEESVDERIMNLPKTDAQLIGIRDKISKSALRSLKQRLAKYMYCSAGDTEIDSKHTHPQGLCSALREDTTYGSIARTSSAFGWWQAADEDNWDTAYSINKTNIDNWIDQVVEYADSPQDLMILMGPTLYRRLKAQFEAANAYEVKGTLAAQGFESMTYNGVEIVKDFLLDRITSTSISIGGTGIGLDRSGIYAGTQAVFVLDMSTWHLRYFEDPQHGGPFDMTEFFNQSKLIGGVDKSLARIFWKGNLTCDMPNRNLMRLNVS